MNHPMQWVLPAIVGASLFRATTVAPEIDRNPAGVSVPVVPGPLLAHLKDPHQPLLNDQWGIPPELAPKTYRGFIELHRPPRLDVNRPNPQAAVLNAPFNKIGIPYVNKLKMIKLWNEAYRMGTKGISRQWSVQKPDTRTYKVVMRYDPQLPATRRGGATRRVSLPGGTTLTRSVQSTKQSH